MADQEQPEQETTSLLLMIDEIVEKLSGPLPSEELMNGWTEESRRAMSDFFKDLQSKLSNKETVPYLGIVRGLDHWGVFGGELFRRVAEIDHKLRHSNGP